MSNSLNTANETTQTNSELRTSQYHLTEHNIICLVVLFFLLGMWL
jgi:hypothetical protein